MARRRRGSDFTVNCGSDEFVEIIHDYMEDHCYEVDDEATKAAGEAGTKAADLLRKRSRRRTGKYARGWTSDARASSTGVEVTVHNKRMPQLTHLLEKDHVIRNRKGGPTYGTVKGDGIIAEVADEVGGEFVRRFQG